jgi:transcriptional regulator with XRE-family HTH domain
MGQRVRSQTEAERWYEWMRGLGASARRLRTLLGLTQEQLGRLAGVSQGAVSRLEAGRGISTPLMVVVRVQQAFQQCIAQIDPQQLPPDAQTVLQGERLGDLGPLDDFRELPLLQEPHLAAYMELWHRVHPGRRKTFLAVVRAAADAMSSLPSPAGDTGDDARHTGLRPTDVGH